MRGMVLCVLVVASVVSSFAPLQLERRHRVVSSPRWSSAFDGEQVEESSSSSESSESSESSSESSSWSLTRRVTGTLALVGSCETSFLTYKKLVAEVPSLCGADCGSVLTGPYSQVYGVPVSALGLGAYLAVLALSVPRVFGLVEERTRLPLLTTTTFMGAFSVYLLGLLAYLGTPCAFCFASAALSLALCFVVQRRHDAEFGRAPTIASVSAAALAASLGFSAVDRAALSSVAPLALSSFQQQAATTSATTTTAVPAAPPNKGPAAAPSSVVQKKKEFDAGGPFSPPPVETSSTPRAIALAKELRKRNAKVYGAYWCSHCFHQKQIFGREALPLLTYVECAADGENSKRTLCQEHNVNGYPTWEIDGKYYPGEKTLAELEDLVGIPTTTTSKKNNDNGPVV